MSRLPGSARGLVWLALSALVVVIDQVTKWVVTTRMSLYERIEVLPFFDWVRWHNDGAAFSMLAGQGGWQRWVFVALGVGFSVFIVWELRRLRFGQKVQALAYALILGGAIGNLIDRVLQGYVVDFVLLYHGDWIFPAFNVADSALSVGAVLWIGLMINEYRQEKGRAADHS